MTAARVAGKGATRVLVVDDNEKIHQDFLKILQREPDRGMEASEELLFGAPTVPRRELPEFRVELADQGEAGVERARQAVAEGEPFSVAFVDMRMPPGWDGVETIERLWEVDADLQVVICTAHADYAWHEVFDRLRHHDQLLILKKPFDSVEVSQIAQSMSEKRELSRLSRLKLHQLERMAYERTAELTMLTDQIRESEERFRQVAENLEDALWLEEGTERRLVFVNPAYERLLGRPAEEIHRDFRAVWHEVIHPDDRDRVGGFLLGDAVDRPVEEAFRMLDREGAVRWVRMRMFPFTTVEFGGSRVAGIAQDITEFKAAQAHLRDAQKLEAVGQLAAGIAHEINTPNQYISDTTRFLDDAFKDLSRVLGLFRKLAAEGLPPGEAEALRAQARELIEEVELEYLEEEIPVAIQQSLEGLGRVGSIVRAMKEFSHPAAETKQAVDLNRAVGSTVTVCRNEWKYVSELETRLDPELPPVPCYIGEINQVVLNLIVNAAHAIEGAIRAGEEKGRIVVSTRRVDDHVEIRVQDSGPGIPDSVGARVFEPFFTTKEVGKGTGQGLALAWATVVEKHGGRLSYQLPPEGGTVFVVGLPLE